MRAYGVTIDRSAFCYRTQRAGADRRSGGGRGDWRWVAPGISRPRREAVLEGQIRIAIDAYVVAHSDLYRSPRIRLLYDHLVTALKAAFAAPGQSG